MYLDEAISVTVLQNFLKSPSRRGAFSTRPRRTCRPPPCCMEITCQDSGVFLKFDDISPPERMTGGDRRRAIGSST
ncbi:MAG: hypothetical protein QXK63_05200 [Thermoproteus sp.]